MIILKYITDVYEEYTNFIICRVNWLFFCQSIFVYSKAKKYSFKLIDLKCEGLVNPLGIDNRIPHFSWKLKGDGLKEGQAYYEIQVSSDSLLLMRDKADLWKSGK